MKPFVFERSQILPTTLDEAWRFFSDPGNLVKITPPAMDFHITSAPQAAAYAGQIITYTVRPLLGINIAWTTEITHVSKPDFFVDEQRFGPYRFWHHQHFFREVDGGIEVRDLVHYLFAHDHLAWLVNRMIVAPRLRKIFDYRSTALQGIFTRISKA
jgi:ligand-binding SRPBCC domain-containing protein